MEGIWPVLGIARRYVFPHWALWVPLAALLVVNVTWIGLSPRLSLSLRSHVMMSSVLLGAPLVVAYAHWRVRSFDRLLDVLVKLLMVALFAAFFTQQVNLFSHLTVSLAMPLADDLLKGWDSALGFDWNAYAQFVASHVWLSAALSFAYGPLIPIAFSALLIVSVWVGCYDRVNEIAFLVLVSGFICIGVSALLPAEAAWNTVATAETKAVLGDALGLFWADQFRALRGSGPVSLDLRDMQGLATFPSFHACLGLIILWTSRGHWLTLSAGIIAGLGVLAATPVFGWHYAVDLLASSFLMAGLILLWNRMDLEPPRPWARP